MLGQDIKLRNCKIYSTTYHTACVKHTICTGIYY